MRTDLFDYDLPPERIAQTPLPRGQSRLMVIHRAGGQIEHRHFTDLIDYLEAGDTLVLNDTRVSARRLQATRESGQSAEVLLLRPVGETGWEALVKPGKSLRPGKTLTLLGPPPEHSILVVPIVATTPEGGRVLEFPDRATRDSLAAWGVAPLPPYIHAPLPHDQEERYQTVYAAQDGSAAAPTAGLHFTPGLLDRIAQKGVGSTYVTLHVGVGTFRPVRSETTDEHEMHSETMFLSAETAQKVNQTTGRVIAVGTTSVRALETVAQMVERQAGESASRRIVPYVGDTRLFLTPGSRFRVVEGLITNFHLPRSTLLMLVSAFAGRELILQAYQEAIREEYRFFSFGDAMLII